MNYKRTDHLAEMPDNLFFLMGLTGGPVSILFYCNRLCQIPWLIHIQIFSHRSIICNKLQHDCYGKYSKPVADIRNVDLNISDWAPWYPVGFHYLGSLTTPPLTEGVEWLVLTNPEFTISDRQIDWFHQHFGDDNRDPQPLNDRQVELYK